MFQMMLVVVVVGLVIWLSFSGRQIKSSAVPMTIAPTAPVVVPVRQIKPRGAIITSSRHARFETRSGGRPLSARVVGVTDDGQQVCLSRKGGPAFRRLVVA